MNLRVVIFCAFLFCPFLVLAKTEHNLGLQTRAPGFYAYLIRVSFYAPELSLESKLGQQTSFLLASGFGLRSLDIDNLNRRLAPLNGYLMSEFRLYTQSPQSRYLKNLEQGNLTSVSGFYGTYLSVGLRQWAGAVERPTLTETFLHFGFQEGIGEEKHTFFNLGLGLSYCRDGWNNYYPAISFRIRLGIDWK